MQCKGSPFSVTLPDGSSMTMGLGALNVCRLECDKAQGGSVMAELVDGYTKDDVANSTVSIKALPAPQGYGQFQCLASDGTVIAQSDVFPLAAA